MLFNLLSEYPKAKRNINNRLINKEANKKIALKFGKEYFDGKRSQGYGGYSYDGRWVTIARKIIEHYNIKEGQKILDIGCAKGFLVKDLLDSKSGVKVFGLDVSEYAILNCHKDCIGHLHIGNARNLPFPDNSFDLVISINTLHNLTRKGCVNALSEIQRVAKRGKAFVQVDSYKNKIDKQNFIDWMLTAKTHGTPNDWIKIFNDAGYKGDYYWTLI
jgi:ubiquinone/menaquinone biosynthesis C-methylase UbiE